MMSSHSNEEKPRRLRSAHWLATRNLAAILHRAALLPAGFDAARPDRPVIGIANSWSEYTACNLGLRSVAMAVREGVEAAGGVACEFPTISLGENLLKPTAMLLRNLMSMDVEESIRGYPMDAVVLLGGCDKNLPAQLLGAASAGVPALALTGGAARPGGGGRSGGGTHIWKALESMRQSGASDDDLEALAELAPTYPGHCAELGSASTFAAIAEVLGFMLPGASTLPHGTVALRAAARATGVRAVEIACARGPTPRELLTAESFTDAAVVLGALGGSSNAVIHLLALARRVGVPLSLEALREPLARMPVLANLVPSGAYLATDLGRVGGVPAILRELSGHLHAHRKLASGRTLGEEARSAPAPDGDVIWACSARRNGRGGLAVVRGSLAPRGAIVKTSTANEALLRHRGPAVVFDGLEDVLARIDDPALEVGAGSVLVLRGCGPVGGPGMPEWGMLPIPRKLAERGVTDMLRVSDARMSGTAFGTVVLHVAPEAAVGGPIALVCDGDEIELDVDSGTLDVLVPPTELARRRARHAGPSLPRYRRGYGALFLAHVLQADEGADFDFLAAVDAEEPEPIPEGLGTGWLGGW